ncbi:fungal specific transcription protein [Diplodia corticola]|uniref:Fungal specific transcription protein n=1 Tax=Diplodia corticola TaxID=236234 RepID=A0A1J9QJR1_9PEZI|nr:fungal specific transcription protein [Diplodia corticola]OJD28705.1 fungal specific transcription protein [Diplodia corticola]
MTLTGERIVSTSTGDVLGSRWGRTPTAPPAHRAAPPTPPQPQPQPQHNGGDIIGTRRAATTAATAATPEPIVSTIDEGDIIGHARRWVPTIDRPSSTPAAAASSSSSTSNNNHLLHSRYAAASLTRRTSPTSTPTPLPSRQQHNNTDQLTKLKRLIDRLSWKSHTLLFTQSVALQSGEALSHHHSTTGSTGSTTGSTGAAAYAPHAQPTTMFKLDFFEYYALLERILVLFLGVFRVPLPPSSSHNIGGGKIDGSGTATGSTRTTGGWAHRYHESVLEALEGTAAGTATGAGVGAEALGAALGNGEVMAALRRAKGFRNRWKDADEQVVVPAWEWQREEVEGLRLRELLGVVLGALERAYRAAEGRVGGEGEGGRGGGGKEEVGSGGGKGTWLEVGAGLQQQQNGYVDEDMEDAPWEAVGDAMEDAMDMDVE